MLAKQPAPVFVLNSLDGNVSVIDPVTWTEKKRIPTGKEPHHLYLTPDEKSLIVANAMSDSLTFIDPRTAQVQRTVTGILDPYHLRFSPDMKWFVTAANRLNHVDIYRWDGQNAHLSKRIATGKTPSHLWIDSRSQTVWATMQDSNEIVSIDLNTQTLTTRTPVGAVPADVYGTPDDKYLMVGLTAPVGPGLIKASYTRTEVEVPGISVDGNQVAVGYEYGLSKRTALEFTYGRDSKAKTATGKNVGGADFTLHHNF